MWFYFTKKGTGGLLLSVEIMRDSSYPRWLQKFTYFQYFILYSPVLLDSSCLLSLKIVTLKVQGGPDTVINCNMYEHFCTTYSLFIAAQWWSPVITIPFQGLLILLPSVLQFSSKNFPFLRFPLHFTFDIFLRCFILRVTPAPVYACGVVIGRWHPVRKYEKRWERGMRKEKGKKE